MRQACGIETHRLAYRQKFLQSYREACSPSALVQQALAQFSAHTPPGISTVTDMSQIRELIRAEFIAMQAEKTAVTDTVTEVVTDTLARDLPELVRQLVEGLALEALGLPVTDAYSNDTDMNGDIADTDSNVTDTEPLREPTPRQREAMRQPILDLLSEHPEGLSAEEIRVYLRPEKPLGDTLQGMRRQGKVHTRGKGKDMRYFVE
jgi:hypothetical protein